MKAISNVDDEKLRGILCPVDIKLLIFLENVTTFQFPRMSRPFFQVFRRPTVSGSQCRLDPCGDGGFLADSAVESTSTADQK
jgi:hypothetical protein